MTGLYFIMHIVTYIYIYIISFCRIIYCFKESSVCATSIEFMSDDMAASDGAGIMVIKEIKYLHNLN